MNIIEKNGVSPVDKDTLRLAHIASFYKKEKILEIGTGTGYVAVFLSKNGAKVDATDINLQAIDCARENAIKNNTRINIFYSNLFEDIEGLYDMIIFNPPLNGKEKKWQAYLKSFIRKSIFKNIVSKIVSRVSQKKRVPFIKNFIIEAKKYLHKDGVIIMHLQSIDIPYLSEHRIKFIEQVFDHTSIVEIS